MNLFGIGAGELVLILFIALLVLGPQRLPEFARQLSKIILQIRNVADEFTSELNRELQLDDLMKPPVRPRQPRTRPPTGVIRPPDASEQPAYPSTQASPQPTAAPASQPAKDEKEIAASAAPSEEMAAKDSAAAEPPGE